MSELWIILHRELTERIRTKGFILSTILTPLFISAVFLVPMLAESWTAEDEQRIAVIDESSLGLGRAVAAQLSGEGSPFRVVTREQPLSAVRASLESEIFAGDLDGYLWIPPGVMQSGMVEYRAESAADRRTQRHLEQAVTDAMRTVRLQDAGLSSERLGALLAPVRVDAGRITRDGGVERSSEGALMFSFMVGFALYFLIILYGAQVAQSVQEEKTNRIAEVLVSSVRPQHLMLGKVLGVGTTALLQVSIWAGVALLAVTQRERIASLLDAPASLLELLSISISPLIGAAMLLYAVLGFFLYASLFATAGATAANPEDIQRFTMPLITPLLIPIILADPIISSPRGTLATTLGWFPLTSPLVMSMRIGTGEVGVAEVIGALLVLAASVYLLGWLAGKIYRVGILSTGKRPSLRELVHWTRTA